MLVVIGEYDVRVGRQPGFVTMYGPGGAWVGLCKEHSGYLDTELLRGEQPAHYFIIDRSASAAGYDVFRHASGTRYAQVNAQGDTLTVAERYFSRYETPC